MKDSATVASQVGVLFGAVAISFLATVPAAAQTTATPRQTRAQSSVVPRTSDGHPDLQGVWDFGSATPLERPAVFANKPVLTDEEAAAFVKNLPMDGCRLVKCDGSAAGRGLANGPQNTEVQHRGLVPPR